VCMKTCQKLLDEARRAYQTDLRRYAALVDEAIEVCDEDSIDGLLAETLVPRAAEAIAREIIAEAAALRSAGLPAAVALMKFWRVQAIAVVGCAVAEAFALSAVKAAKEAGWPWRRWVLAAVALEALHRHCGGVPDGVVEELGPEEWAELESYLHDGAAEVALGGERMLVISGWRLP